MIRSALTALAAFLGRKVIARVVKAAITRVIRR
jgi:hypothetical protein